MAEKDKKFYWLKLKDSFMTSDTVDFLMSQKNGANYVVLYQVLCLKTINTDGTLARTIGEMLIPYDAEKIQRDCKWFDIDTVRVAIELYKNLGLVYLQYNGVLKITDFENLVGNETYWAKQKRVERLNISLAKEDNEQLENNETISIGQCPTNVQNPLISNIYNLNSNNIIEYLNKVIGSKYRATSEKTKKLITARLNEGFSEENFFTVIDKQAKRWLNTDMAVYLRPETLFGTKFESYLNAAETTATKQITAAYKGREYKEEELKQVFKDVDNFEEDIV